MNIEEMSAKDLFLAFCKKAGINVSAHKNKTDIERFGLFNGVGMAEFLFDKDGNFIKYDIFKGETIE